MFFNGLLIDFSEHLGVFAVHHNGVLLIEVVVGVVYLHHWLIKHKDVLALVIPCCLGIGKPQYIFLFLITWLSSDIRVFDKFIPVNSLLLLKLQTPIQEVKPLQTQFQILRQLISPSLQVLFQVVPVSTCEGSETCYQLKEDYSERPNVCFVVVTNAI